MRKSDLSHDLTQVDFSESTHAANLNLRPSELMAGNRAAKMQRRRRRKGGRGNEIGQVKVKCAE